MKSQHGMDISPTEVKKLKVQEFFFTATAYVAVANVHFVPMWLRIKFEKPTHKLCLFLHFHFFRLSSASLSQISLRLTRKPALVIIAHEVMELTSEEYKCSITRRASAVFKLIESAHR